MYYQARKVDYRPFLIFDKVAYTDEELISRKLCKFTEKEIEGKMTFVPEKPLNLIEGVFIEKDIPKEKFGVCLKALNEEGKIIDRPQEEIQQAEKDQKAEQLVESFRNIDNQTQAKIREGFEFDGKRFSLSSKAQLNWTSLAFLQASKTFGESQEISTADHQSYTLTQENLVAFLKVSRSKIAQEMEAGRIKKAELRNQK